MERQRILPPPVQALSHLHARKGGRKEFTDFLSTKDNGGSNAKARLTQKAPY